MGQSLLHEPLIPIKNIQTHLGIIVSRRTIFRWLTNGYNGIVLESFKIGKKRYTTKTMLERFINQVNSRNQSD